MAFFNLIEFLGKDGNWIMAMLTTKYHVTRSFLRIGILTTGLLSLIVGLLAFFGQNMGTFVISMGDDLYEAGIVLSDSKEFTTAVPRLLVNPQNDAYPVSYADLKLEQAMATDGDFKDPDGYTYIAYTFYLQNNGTSITDIDFNITMSTATNNIAKCLRVMLIEDDTYYHVYMEHDEDISPKDPTPVEYMEDFVDDVTVCQSSIKSFRPTEIRKYTLFIWLEGWDIDCTKQVKSGQLRMEMTFNVVRNVVVDED